ncbi:hypothetical protein PsorP6_015139 [Peronosclerospora sorghi]|uniref:Uncharacterized protein n=1 Tax=Peronosclerospora sorghi TaxID=230839 RepID=A0ACC0VRX1_9STRA|nr:hypothetical protein PsorP6_015139 [Peronosclerospora sorghi]
MYTPPALARKMTPGYQYLEHRPTPWPRPPKTPSTSHSHLDTLQASPHCAYASPTQQLSRPSSQAWRTPSHLAHL